MGPPLKMYHELAEWWPLLSHPVDYAEEASIIAGHLASLARRPVLEVLELGSGGGNNASYLKEWFRMTLCDVSHEMLAVSMALNPECEHIHGDMRTVRLGRTFDAVLIHDAIMYMTTQEDLAAALNTAAAHVAPGGSVVIVPDHTLESYKPFTSSGGHDGEGRALRYLEWCHPPVGTKASVTFVIVTKEADEAPRVVLDEHEFGLFPLATWRRLLAEAGFEVHVLTDSLADVPLDEQRQIFGGVAPGD